MIECWPRWVNPRHQNAPQYEGWPHTVRMEENYARTPVAWLPTLQVTGSERPVVEVTREDNTLVHARRYPSARIDLPVFAEGTYVVRVSDPDRGRSATVSLKATRSKGATGLPVTLK